MKFTRMILIAAIAVFGFAACKPSDPPPDLVKKQRETLEQSKAVESQLQNQAEAQKKAIDDAAK